ncbi:hypothetical protein FK220_002330 [Flavobacteriaceae bacterium TP-CH-4]|uniref:DUF7079 domain-containing protein n=1 Tax=Pelagihabitans pacificus TaxID=2696054 RepID=A0A967APQ2_9FLAO|nr:hypothetical protein [Pelagihabitans pacificus]NHF58161.1 hypothetical protein [Pelagihabitans pacificus]
MGTIDSIDERKIIWIALSDMYLDTELQEYHFKHIARTIAESNYSFEEVRKIDREEVFPVLYTNLLSVAGVWDGFQEEWLVQAILEKMGKKRFKDRIITPLVYWKMKGMFRQHWDKVGEELHKIVS